MDVSGGESKVRWCKEQYCIRAQTVRFMNQGKVDVVKQEVARVNINIFGISELKWTGKGELNSDNHYIYYYPLLLPSVFPSIGVFSNESALLIRWPKY